MKEKIKDILRSFFVIELGLELKDDDTDIMGAGADSLDMVESVMEVENKLHVTVNDDNDDFSYTGSINQLAEKVFNNIERPDPDNT